MRKASLREKCPNRGKYGPEQTSYLDSVAILDDKIIQLKSRELRIW